MVKKKVATVASEWHSATKKSIELLSRAAGSQEQVIDYKCLSSSPNEN